MLPYLAEAGCAYMSELTSSSSRASEHLVAHLFSKQEPRVSVIAGHVVSSSRMRLLTKITKHEPALNAS